MLARGFSSCRLIRLAFPAGAVSNFPRVPAMGCRGDSLGRNRFAGQKMEADVCEGRNDLSFPINFAAVNFLQPKAASVGITESSII